jgi:IS1 family transposase
LHVFSAYFLNELQLNQVQLDELYAVLSAVREGEVSAAEAVERLSRSPHWVWTVIAPESKLLLSVQMGERTLAMAQAVLHQITQLVAPGCVPLFVSDGYPNYLPAIVSHFGHWVQPPRRQDKGPVPKPRWMPLAALLYAQVVKATRQRRIVEVKHRVVFGTPAEVEKILLVCGWQINTSFVERLNLSLRQWVAAIRRRSATPCKSKARWLRGFCRSRSNLWSLKWGMPVPRYCTHSMAVLTAWGSSSALMGCMVGSALPRCSTHRLWAMCLRHAGHMLSPGQTTAQGQHRRRHWYCGDRRLGDSLDVAGPPPNTPCPVHSTWPQSPQRARAKFAQG